MAEQAALKKRGTSVKRLKAAIKLLSDVLERDDDVHPTVEQLTKNIATIEQAWDKFDAAHFAYLELVEEETEAEEGEYQELTERANNLIGEAQHMVAVRRGEVVQDAPAAASLAQQIDVAKAELEGVFEDINGVLKAVGTHLKATSISQESLKVCAQQLNHAEELLEGGGPKDALKELVRLKPAEAAGNTAAKAIKVGEVRMNLEALRESVGSALAKVAPRAVPAPRATAAAVATAFKKRDPPKFDGQRRNYPSFKKEWLVSVTGKLDPSTEVREMKYSVPTIDEPDLKNLYSMEAIWAVLDEKYGKVMELSKELIMGLQRFNFSKAARTESAKFRELFREWSKVYNDLEQVDKLSVLDHEPTLCNIAKMFPSSNSKMRYAALRRKLQEANTDLREHQEAAEEEVVAEITELHMMHTFMKGEKKLQDDLEYLGRSEVEPSSRTRERSSPGQCPKCGEPGHKAAECEEWQFYPEEWKEGKSGSTVVANANMRMKPQDCPACQSQHTFFMEGDNSIRYKTRLSSCSDFVKMSVRERASLVEKEGACALCTDWTGSHTRENCEENESKGVRFSDCDVDVSGTPCGKKHHRLLHGSTSKFTNHMASRFSRHMTANVVKEEKIIKLPRQDTSAGSARKKQKKAYAVRCAEAVELVAIHEDDSFIETEKAKAVYTAQQCKLLAEVEAWGEEDAEPGLQVELSPPSKELLAEVEAWGSEEEEHLKELTTQANSIEEKLVKQADAKEESLRKLLKTTAVQVENTLEEMTEVDSTRLKFWQVLDVLNIAEDEERVSGKKQTELGQLSIRKFKQEAMLNFGNAIRRMNDKKSQEESTAEVESSEDAKADEVVASRRSKPEAEARKLSDLSDEEVMLLIPEEVKLIMQRVMQKEQVFNVKEQKLHRITPLVMDRLLPPDYDAVAGH